MSNIANQVIAVVATLLGFVAHDALTQRNTPTTTVVASASDSSVDPIVTRAIDLDAISSDWTKETPRGERAGQARPAMPTPAGTATVRLGVHETQAQFANVRANGVRSLGAGFLR